MSAAYPIDAGVWLEHSWRNRIHSVLLLAVMAGFLGVLGWLLWGWDGLLVLVSLGAVAVLANPTLSPWLVMRMYDADLNGARLTGNPEGLARALAKIDRLQGGWLERVFLPGRRVPEPSLLRTHPETEERIARLMALTSEFKGADYPWPRREAVLDIDALLGGRVRRVPRWHMNGLWY